MGLAKYVTDIGGTKYALPDRVVTWAKSVVNDRGEVLREGGNKHFIFAPGTRNPCYMSLFRGAASVSDIICHMLLRESGTQSSRGGIMFLVQ